LGNGAVPLTNACRPEQDAQGVRFGVQGIEPGLNRVGA
jgi:hypothetical protein